ncbi:hypothetical protein HanXRQr2_Chr12g0532681 [Helianthus annuus]|uniref:Uncharacterized protein n=1 Tax=Helianthus annuus TaxID=4232 RepID=A0A9K3MUW2_HELAN|nr:hypothetical protein HanXRQr2_Chr12g0532681 [Helianthus annuus]
MNELQQPLQRCLEKINQKKKKNTCTTWQQSFSNLHILLVLRFLSQASIYLQI